MRFKHLVPVLFLMVAATSASADVLDNFSAMSGKVTGGAANDWFVGVRFSQTHVVFFENDSVPRGTLIELSVGLTKNDFSEQWTGDAVLPKSAATFGPNFGYATVKATLDLTNTSTGETRPFTVDIRIDGTGDIGGGHGFCHFTYNLPTYTNKSFSSYTSQSRDSVLAAGSSISDGVTDYLSGFSPTYPNLIEQGRTFFNNPGSL